MAIYSFRMGERVSRGGGKSAVKIAAYQARENLQDARTGYHYNHAPKERAELANSIAAASAYMARGAGYADGRLDALFVGLYAPSEAPDWCRGRENIEQFWGKAELAERRQDAHLAERFIIALPHELTVQQNVWLLQDFITAAFVRQGRVVQVAIHAPEHGDGRNIHAHLLVSTRGVDAGGFKATKAAEQKERHLYRRQYVTDLRERWEATANHHLQRHGIEARIDHRSLAEQGIEREATIHLGPGDSRRERQGIASAAGEINREIATQNAQRATAEVVDLDAWRMGLERPQTRATKPQERREAAQGAERGATLSLGSGTRRRAQELTPGEDAAIRAIDAWRSGVEREWQGQGSPVKPVERDPKAEARRERLEQLAWIDRKPGSRDAQTLEGVARELSSDYRDALAQTQEQAGAIAKAERQVAGARGNRAIAEANIEDRQRQMPGWRRALHNTGLRADGELTKWQKQARIAEIVEERGYTHKTTAAAALAMWERRADAALETVRPAAERELAQRQNRAENARARLAQRGAWITDPEMVEGIERDDLAAWHTFVVSQGPRAAPGHKQAQTARPKQSAEREETAQREKFAPEDAEQAVQRYVSGMIARARSRPEHQAETEAQRQSQRQSQGLGLGL
jgi:hypothetical protein